MFIVLGALAVVPGCREEKRVDVYYDRSTVEFDRPAPATAEPAGPEVTNAVEEQSYDQSGAGGFAELDAAPEAPPEEAGVSLVDLAEPVDPNTGLPAGGEPWELGEFDRYVIEESDDTVDQAVSLIADRLADSSLFELPREGEQPEAEPAAVAVAAAPVGGAVTVVNPVVGVASPAVYGSPLILQSHVWSPVPVWAPTCRLLGSPIWTSPYIAYGRRLWPPYRADVYPRWIEDYYLGLPSSGWWNYRPGWDPPWVAHAGLYPYYPYYTSGTSLGLGLSWGSGSSHGWLSFGWSSISPVYVPDYHVVHYVHPPWGFDLGWRRRHPHHRIRSPRVDIVYHSANARQPRVAGPTVRRLGPTRNTALLRSARPGELNDAVSRRRSALAGSSPAVGSKATVALPPVPSSTVPRASAVTPRTRSGALERRTLRTSADRTATPAGTSAAPRRTTSSREELSRRVAEVRAARGRPANKVTAAGPSSVPLVRPLAEPSLRRSPTRSPLRASAVTRTPGTVSRGLVRPLEELTPSASPSRPSYRPGTTTRPPSRPSRTLVRPLEDSTPSPSAGRSPWRPSTVRTPTTPTRVTPAPGTSSRSPAPKPVLRSSPTRSSWRPTTTVRPAPTRTPAPAPVSRRTTSGTIRYIPSPARPSSSSVPRPTTPKTPTLRVPSYRSLPSTSGRSPTTSTRRSQASLSARYEAMRRGSRTTTTARPSTSSRIRTPAPAPRVVLRPSTSTRSRPVPTRSTRAPAPTRTRAPTTSSRSSRLGSLRSRAARSAAPPASSSEKPSK